MTSHWQRVAAANGFMAIALGAVAAHGIHDGAMAALAEKASLYQLIHAAVLLWLSDRQGRTARLARWVMLAGIALFCGSLYLKAIFLWGTATTLAPLGGMSLMAGWLILALR